MKGLGLLGIIAAGAAALWYALSQGTTSSSVTSSGSILSHISDQTGIPTPAPDPQSISILNAGGPEQHLPDFLTATPQTATPVLADQAVIAQGFDPYSMLA